jgi:hypothetical protein
MTVGDGGFCCCNFRFLQWNSVLSCRSMFERANRMKCDENSCLKVNSVSEIVNYSLNCEM